jgi:hypothetical protein
MPWHWRDSISRPIAPIYTVAGGDDTTSSGYEFALFKEPGSQHAYAGTRPFAYFVFAYNFYAQYIFLILKRGAQSRGTALHLWVNIPPWGRTLFVDLGVRIWTAKFPTRAEFPTWAQNFW